MVRDARRCRAEPHRESTTGNATQEIRRLKPSLRANGSTLENALACPIVLMRDTADLSKRINVICPVQPCLQKYFRSRLTQITSISLAVLPHMRGVSRSSRTRGGMRWTRQRWVTNGADADGAGLVS